MIYDSHWNEISFLGCFKRSALFYFYFCCCVGISVPFSVSAQSISVDEKADTMEMSYRAFGLTPRESLLVEKSLQKISTPEYVYIVIHGDNEVFKIWEGTQWKEITHRSLARWISETRTYNDKTIVLLSCNNPQTTQALSNSLAKLDTTAKPRRKVRNVIAWDEATFISENGYITGEGACRIFSPSTVKGTLPRSKTLSGCQIPHGVGWEVEDLDFMMLGGPELTLMKLFTKDEKVEFEWSLLNLRRDHKELYQAIETEIFTTPKIQQLLQEQKTATLQKRLREIKTAIDREIMTQKTDPNAPRLWDAWFYLKKRQKKALYINNLAVLQATQLIMKEYFNQPKAADYEKNFNFFLATCEDIDGSKIKQLKGQTSLEGFQAAIQKIAKGELLLDYLSNRSFEEALIKNPKEEAQQAAFFKLFKRKPAIVPKLTQESTRVQNLAVWASSEPNAAWYFKTTPKETTVPQLPKIAFDALNHYFDMDYVTKVSNPASYSVEDTRKPMVKKVNQILGETIKDIKELRSLTSKKGLITKVSSWGSIFEGWVRAKFFVAANAPKDIKEANQTALESPQKYLNEGKARFYMTIEKDKRSVAPEGTITSNGRDIDCSYLEPNESDPTCTKVCVELKHIEGKFEKEVIIQFQDNVKLVRAKRIKRIEYIFSTLAAARDNKDIFLPPNLTTDDSIGFRPNESNRLFRVFFIDDNGDKQPIGY